MIPSFFSITKTRVCYRFENNDFTLCLVIINSFFRYNRQPLLIVAFLEALVVLSSKDQLATTLSFVESQRIHPNRADKREGGVNFSLLKEAISHNL